MAKIKNTSKNKIMGMSSSIKEMIKQQQKAEIPKSGETKPTDTPLVAKAHTPIYLMHRYFARRPYNVFEALVKHYSSPGNTILDPFMGGGVTVIEALRARRKVIGVDLNPVACFITKNEVKPVDSEKINSAVEKLKSTVKVKINELYSVKCDNCGGMATTKWAYWSSVVRCPNMLCGTSIVTETAKKIVNDEYRHYECPKCEQRFEPADCERSGDKLLRLKYECESCHHSEIRDATDDDLARYQTIIDNFDSIVASSNLEFPQDKIPDADRVRDDALYKKGYKYFYQLFTKRNLLANALLKKSINDPQLDGDTKEALLFVFSSSLSWSNKMRKDIGHGWEHHGYWLPETFYESNVWDVFEKQYDSGVHSFLKGKQYSAKEIGSFGKLAHDFDEIKNNKATCLLLCTSSHSLPLLDNSVDVVITDPPFGGNVQYAELCDFWAVWIKDVLGLNGIIDNKNEAIQTRHSGFETEKSLEHYENMLFWVFKECHRVLKPNGWMVMTFHNRDLAVWMALHRAASKAGFKLPPESVDKNRGMLYQPPIEHYTTTMHQRAAGSMLGDFILSFKRQDLPGALTPVGELSTAEEEALINKTAELIKFHGGADDSTLMTGLIPYLNEKNLFGKLANADFRPLFENHFIWDKKEKKWFTQDMVEPATSKLKPLDFIPVEKLTESIVYPFLKDKKYASLDEILSVIYANLVNSHRPGIQTVNRVLNKIAETVPLPGSKSREGYRLKPNLPETPEVKTPALATQISLFGGSVITNLLSHDEIIALIYGYATKMGYDVHIGETEQNKNSQFKAISRHMRSDVNSGHQTFHAASSPA
jgi:DNA modification methylase